MDIGKQIRSIRKQRGLTQIQLAEKVGMAVNSIRLYEAGKRIPSIDVRLELAEALDCGFDELMTKKEASDVASILEKGYMSRAEEEMLDSPTQEDMVSRFGQPDNVASPQPSFPVWFHDIGYQANLILNDLVKHFRNLNTEGMQEASKRVEELAMLPKYQRTPTAKRTEIPPEPPATAQPSTDTPNEEKPPEGHSGPKDGK
ncbi:MAG: helix-turn-helix domain-containing protein [Aristaeellaceae bacterium]